MLESINNIINSVGSSKKKLITLLILLAFVGAFYVFKTLEYKDDCSGLIEQNQKLIGRNMDVIRVNNKLMDNNFLLSKISDMEVLLITKDSLLLQSNKRSDILTLRVRNSIRNQQVRDNDNNQFMNENENENMDMHVSMDIMSAPPKPIHIEEVRSVNPDSLYTVTATTDQLNNIDSTAYSNNSTAYTLKRKRGFFRRLFKF